jgi:lipopolysaccharide/colanic/teichoic acid biosynthesis glycosyltransferase
MNGERARTAAATFGRAPGPTSTIGSNGVAEHAHVRRVLVGRADRAELRARLERAVPGIDLRFLDVAALDGQLVDELRREAPDEVYIDLDAGLDEATLNAIGARLLMDGAVLHFVLSQVGRPPVRATVRALGNDCIVSLHAVSDAALSRLVRRVVDVVGAALLLVLLSPVFAVVAALVWTAMGRPIVYVQERLGRGGRRFPLFKFRTMVVDAESRLRRTPGAWQRYVESDFKLPADEDVRITPLGRVLRRTSLDELPQLWNVLRGEMSLVGPRAIVPEELAEYGEYGRMLLRVKPGLTGVWQVSGRSTISYPERARMDLRYVEGRTLRGDLGILVRTLPAVIRQRGAL